MNSIAYLNGLFLPLEETRVSAMDRGFLMGDGVYEVIPVYNNKPFRLQPHLNRLRKSLEAIHLTLDMPDKSWHALVNKLIEKNNFLNSTIYLQVTRGAELERNFTFPHDTQPTVFAFCHPLSAKTIEQMSQGISVITLTDIRWHYCRTKAITLLANVLLRQQAYEQDADEAILIREERPIEGTSSNLFIVKNQVLLTPPLTDEILGGITRELILELAKKNNIPFEERHLTLSELLTADEVWLSSTTREISPVVKIDNKPVKDGNAGPLWYRMIQLYQHFKQNANESC